MCCFVIAWAQLLTFSRSAKFSLHIFVFLSLKARGAVRRFKMCFPSLDAASARLALRCLNSSFFRFILNATTPICKQESLTSNNKTKLMCQLKLCNSPFVMDLDQGLCCFVCFKACMFIARGVEVIVGFTGSTAGAWQSGYIKLKINGCAFICICPHPVTPILHRHSLTADKKQSDSEMVQRNSSVKKWFILYE